MSNGALDHLADMRKCAFYLEELRRSIDYVEKAEILKYRDSEEDLFIISDRMGYFIWTNAYVAECLGWPEYGLIGQSWGAMLHPDDTSERFRAFAVLSARGIKRDDNIVLRYRRYDKKSYVKLYWYFSTAWVENMVYALGKYMGPELRPEVFG